MNKSKTENKKDIFTLEDGVSLKEFFLFKLETQDKALEVAFNAQEKALVISREFFLSKLESQERALALARESLEKRLEGMNEFRAELTKNTSTYLTKDTYDERHDIVQKQIDELKISRALLAGAASQFSVSIAYLIAVIGVILSAISFFRG